MDIKLIPTDDGLFDAVFENNDLSTDEGLQTAVTVSLFTDARVDKEELPEGETDQRGWWGDALNDDNDKIGSKLWTLERQKITTQVLEDFKQFSEESLQWLIDDQIAASINVVVERVDNFSISVVIEITRPQDERQRYRYGYLWKAHGVQQTNT